MSKKDDWNCGHCLYHKKVNEYWVCDNDNSECYGEYTEYNEKCEEFEERQARTNFSVDIVKR